MDRRSDAGVITPRSPSTNPAPRAGRRRKGVARLIGGLGMLVLAMTLLWLLTDASFQVTPASVTVEGAHYADEAAIRGQLEGLERVPNVFRVRASELVADLRALLQVSSVSAVVTLPADVTVRIREREPLFRWTDGKQAWLVDSSGVLFAQVAVLEPALASEADTEASASAAPEPDVAPSVESRPDLPEVEDHRLLAEPLSAGALIPRMDLEVVRQLLAVTPALLGSASERLTLSIDQADGYVLRSDLGWQAVFGHYTPTLQPPAVVPRQVQCLSWLLPGREQRLVRVRLAVSDDVCGTFTRSGGDD